MLQSYSEFKVSLEYESYIDIDCTTFLKKKRLKEQDGMLSDDNTSKKTNDFSDSISNNTNNMNFPYLNTDYEFIYLYIYKKYVGSNYKVDLSLEEFKEIMDSSDSVDIQKFNDEESISDNLFDFIQNNSTKIQNNNNIKKNKSKIIQNNINKNAKIKISREDYIKYGERKFQKDNISQKLFKKFNDWIIKKIEDKTPELLKKKIIPPDYDIFTHNTNLKDIRFYLDIQFKNILIMTKNDKDSLDQLLIIKGIKNKRNYYETNLNAKELKYGEILLKKLNKIKENENIDETKIKDLIINILIEKGYKKEEIEKKKGKGKGKEKEKEEEKKKIFTKKDKDNFNQLLTQYNIKKSFKNQEKNEKYIDDIENKITIEELKMTLRQLLLIFFDSECKEFQEFKNEVKENNKYFEGLNDFSLLELNESKTSCGFIDMVERDCSIPDEKIKILNHITNYFINKKINKAEIEKYLELYPEEK